MATGDLTGASRGTKEWPFWNFTAKFCVTFKRDGTGGLKRLFKMQRLCARAECYNGMFPIKKNGVPGLILAALYLRQCRVVETFRFVWEG